MHRLRSVLAVGWALVLVTTACTTSTMSDEPVSSSPTTASTMDPAPPGTEQPASAGSTTPVPSATTAPESTTAASDGPVPTFDDGPCEFDVPEGRSVRCGWLEVPADRSDSASGTIRLHVAVFESESPDPAADPIVYLEGGPGGDSLELVPIVFEDAFAHLLADRELIFIDQRGTGFSEPSLACPELRELGLELIDDDLPLEELVGRQLETIAACRDRLADEGADLAAHSSAASAADLADLRRALGIEEWNLYGTSYGTRLALTTVRDHPEGIRSVVLDSAYPPDVDIIAATPANLDRALQELFDGCAADPACAAAYPDLADTFYALLRNLDDEPIRAPVTDIFTGEVYDAVFTGGALGSIVFQALYSADAIPILPQLIDHVAAGDTYELSLLTSSFLANREFVSAGMQLSVQCQEEVAFTSPEAVAAALSDHPELEPIFAGLPSLGEPVFEVCAVWDVGAAPPVENEPVRSGIPTLILAGEYDPITPPSWGRRAAASLDDVTFAEFPGLGHGPSAAHPCPQEVVRSFIAAPEAPVETACIADMAPPSFVTPDRAIPPVQLEAYTTRSPGAEWSGVVPAGWSEEAAGVWIRALDGLDQTTIVQQVATGASPPLVLASLRRQFGLGDDAVPVGVHPSVAGEWVLYEGAAAGVPASIALAEIAEGTAIVILLGSPGEHDQLRDEVFLPALDAFAVS